MQIEFTLITLDSANEKAKLSLIGPDILTGLQQPESNDPIHHKSKWRPEYASYMIEGVWSSASGVASVLVPSHQEPLGPRPMEAASSISTKSRPT